MKSYIPSNVGKATLSGIDYSGNNIQENQNSNLDACIAACDAKNECVASVFGTDNNICYLKSSIDQPSVNSNRKTTVKPVKNQDLPPAASIKCIANDPLGNNSGAVYRYTNNNNNRTIFHYPNPDIANSWDPKWSDGKYIDCSGITKGSSLGVLPVMSGASIKCNAGIPPGHTDGSVWRFTNNNNNPTINYYPTGDIANSFDLDWGYPSTIDCSGIKVGPNLTAVTKQAGAPVQCDNNDPKGSNSGAVYRYNNGTIQHYPNPTVAGSWDQNWPQFTKLDCAGLILGPPLAQKIYTNSGNNLSNWNISSTSIGNANIGGFNGDAIIVANDGSCNRDIQKSFLNTVIKFRVCIGVLADLRFACGAAGDGTALRLDTRPNNKSGFAKNNSWTSYASLDFTGPILNSGTWYNVEISIGSDGKASYYIEGIWQGTMAAIENKGNYIGLMSGGGGQSYFTDISIFGSSTFVQPPKKEGSINLYLNSIPNLNFEKWKNPAEGSNPITITNNGWFQAPGNSSNACIAVRSLMNTTITFMVNTQNLCDFFFACDKSGRGQMLRLDARGGAQSGFITTNSWTSWNSINSGPTIPSNVWLKIQLNTDSNGTSTWYINGIKQPGSIGGINGSNTFIGLQGDGGGGTSAFTNISIDYPAKEPTMILTQLLNSNNTDGWSGSCVNPWFSQNAGGILCEGNGKVSKRDLGASIFNRTIKFRFHTDSLGDFYFGCDSNGKGYALRLDKRGGNYNCGFMTTNSWSGWSSPPVGNYVLNNDWYDVAIVIDAFGVCTFYLSGNDKGISKQTMQLPTNAGSWIGLQGDGGGGYSWWTNITIQ